MKKLKFKEGDIVVINGEEYKYNNYYKKLALVSERRESTPIHVLCAKCFGDTFTLRYGEYKIIADCDCGHSMTVYDG